MTFVSDWYGQKNMSLVSPDKFQHILRVQNTNIDGEYSTFYWKRSTLKKFEFWLIIISRYPQHHVRHDCHPWYWSSFLQSDLQKGWYWLVKGKIIHSKNKLQVLTSVPVNWTRTRSVAWRLSCLTQDNTRSPIGSWTDKRTGRTVPLVNLSPTVLTPSSVRIWSVSRR